jgi:hypothetical protein
METPQKETIYIAIITAVLGGIMILRNIDSILKHIKNLISQYAEYWRIRSEKEKQQLQESRLRTAFFVKAIQLGIAEQKLSELNEKIRRQQNENKVGFSSNRNRADRP